VYGAPLAGRPPPTNPPFGRGGGTDGAVRGGTAIGVTTCVDGAMSFGIRACGTSGADERITGALSGGFGARALALAAGFAALFFATRFADVFARGASLAAAFLWSI